MKHWVLGSFCCLLLGACAGDVGLIDRTQPGKLRKSAIEGEWYYRQTVIDVPYTAGVTFVGEQSLTDRMRWEISEDFLTAYRTYERVQGSEVPSQLPGSEYQGAPLAAFKILKHFDVIREYHEATGEQTNVLVENDVDRAWYQRSYIRVDWSTNLLANFDFLAGGEGGLSVTAQPGSYVVTDPRDPDAPVFAVADGAGWTDYRDPSQWGMLDEVDYFDLTLKMQVEPETFLLWYDDYTTEEWPACWFYDLGPWDCASSTIKVRSSFLKVTESDYTPLYYPDNYVARNADGEAIRKMLDYGTGYWRRCTADEGADCKPVRIPMFDWFGYFRTEREVYDRDWEITEEGRLYLINRFNIWQRSRADDGTPMPMEFRSPKTTTYYLSEGFPSDLLGNAQRVSDWWNSAFSDTVASLQGPAPSIRMFDIRQNTYRAGADGIEDFGQRNGDLRYSHLYWVDVPQFESLLGYGPSAADPLTGEVISADAYVYGAAIDSWANHAADVVDLMRGEISVNEFVDGENVGPAIAAIGNRPGIDPAAMRQRVQRAMQRGLGSRLANLRAAGRESYRSGHDYTASRLRRADGNPLFDALWNDEMRIALESRLGKQAPSQTGGRLARALGRHRRELGKHAVCMRDFEDAAVLGLVDRFGTESREQVVAALRGWMFEGTATHEVGHTVGLRHNFAGSTDALNYFDEYWDIRDPGAVALDLPTRAEMQGGLREVGYASIMDYSSKFINDLRGLGKYDRAAIKFGYGELVEAFVSPPDWQEHPIIEYYNLDVAVDEMLHYTQLPELFETTVGSGDGVTNMRARVDVPMKDVVRWMSLENGADDYTDTLVPYKFCSDEYASATWDCDMFDEGADPYEIVSHKIQDHRDYYIFTSFKRHRRYIDPFEYYYGSYYRTMAPMATQYQLWLFDQWWKAGEWAYLADEDASWGTAMTQDADWNLDPNGGLAWTAAAMASMNFLAEVVATPEPGSYYTDPVTGNLLWWADWEDRICGPGEDSAVDDCSDVYIPLGSGRWAFSAFDADSGYYWYERIKVVGSFWDKLAAVETLADPTSYFLGVDDVADYSTYVLGFNVAFPNAVGTLFGASIADDYSRYAAQLEPDGSVSIPSIFDTVSGAYDDVPATPRPGPFIDPATNFTIALHSMYYGMALLNANFDQSFNDHAKIWIDGSGEAFTPAVGADVAEFIDPYNNRSYKAVRAADPDAYSLGWAMVTKAAGYRAAIEANAACDFFDDADPCWGEKYEMGTLIENMEVIRGYYDVFGYAWF